MRTGYIALVVAAALMAPTVSNAQDRWSLELLPGIAIPTEELDQAELDMGVGGDVTLGYRVLPHLSIYGGWGWRHFATDDSLVGSDIDVEETGYLFGVRFEHPMGGERAPAIVLRLGGTYNHIEIEDGSGAIVEDSGHGLGYEAGAGVAFRLGDNWSVTPGVRFRSQEREFDVGGVKIPATLRYVAVEVGFTRRF